MSDSIFSWCTWTVYERLIERANSYLSFEAEFLMRSDAKNIPPTHPKCILFLDLPFSDIGTEMLGNRTVLSVLSHMIRVLM